MKKATVVLPYDEEKLAALRKADAIFRGRFAKQG